MVKPETRKKSAVEKTRAVVKIRDGPRAPSISERDQKAVQPQQIRWPGSIVGRWGLSASVRVVACRRAVYHKDAQEEEGAARLHNVRAIGIGNRSGYRRLSDLRYYQDDPMVRRTLGLEL